MQFERVNLTTDCIFFATVYIAVSTSDKNACLEGSVNNELPDTGVPGACMLRLWKLTFLKPPADCKTFLGPFLVSRREQMLDKCCEAIKTSQRRAKRRSSCTTCDTWPLPKQGSAQTCTLPYFISHKCVHQRAFCGLASEPHL